MPRRVRQNINISVRPESNCEFRDISHTGLTKFAFYKQGHNASCDHIERRTSQSTLQHPFLEH